MRASYLGVVLSLVGIWGPQTRGFGVLKPGP
uniref:Uncharacterized protein n=1 Tax=Arundo donax TaxID=35708 RepID=A0A0A9CGY7_ARUDO